MAAVEIISCGLLPFLARCASLAHGPEHEKTPGPALLPLYSRGQLPGSGATPLHYASLTLAHSAPTPQPATGAPRQRERAVDTGEGPGPAAVPVL